MITWETTTEDVLCAIEQLGGVTVDVDMEEHKIDELHDLLDHDAICKEALRGLDIETQTDYAYEEIVRQLKEMGQL